MPKSKKDALRDMIARALRGGAVGVIPTDTIYGIVANARDPRAVGRVYELRRRSPEKPFIVLIPSVRALAAFGVTLDRYRRAFLKEAWPGPISIILPAPSPALRYLHRGTRSLAFRVPADAALRALLTKTGPLIAPSANPEGGTPARTIQEAQKYFGADADFYVDGGRITGKASALVSLLGEEPVVLRP